MAVELRPGVWHLGLRGVNAYLVEDGGDLTLVDAGLPWHADAVKRGLEVAGYSPRDLDRVLVTHYDLDHVGGLRSVLAAAGDVPVYCGAGDADLVAGDRKPPLSVPKGIAQRFGRLLTPSVDADVEGLADGDEVGGFEVVETPGHTPGHVAYLHDDRDTAVLGDLVREDDGELAPSPWFLSSDTDQVRASIRRVLDRTSDFSVACVGHGDPLREGGWDALSRLG
jgi:glyoxylase-like metal-dependent hydrolase (beta-lactamase superfamily II)